MPDFGCGWNSLSNEVRYQSMGGTVLRRKKKSNIASVRVLSLADVKRGLESHGKKPVKRIKSMRLRHLPLELEGKREAQLFQTHNF